RRDDAKALPIRGERRRVVDLLVSLARSPDLAEIEPHGTIKYTLKSELLGIPGFRNEQLLEEADGVTVGHAGDEVARRGVEAFGVDRAAIEELIGMLAHLVPESAEDVGGLAELRGRDRVLVHRFEQKAAQAENRVEHAPAHPDLRQVSGQRFGDDVLDERRDARRRARAERVNRLARKLIRLQQPGARR